jgi:hypothetical protein
LWARGAGERFPETREAWWDNVAAGRRWTVDDEREASDHPDDDVGRTKSAARANGRLQFEDSPMENAGTPTPSEPPGVEANLNPLSVASIRHWRGRLCETTARGRRNPDAELVAETLRPDHTRSLRRSERHHERRPRPSNCRLDPNVETGRGRAERGGRQEHHEQPRRKHGR